MHQSTYYVDKTTDTFADVLLAYGVASLLDHILQDNADRKAVRVQDAGSVYAINLEPAIQEGFEEIDWFCDLPFLKAWGKKPPEGWLGEVVDYDEEQERISEYFEARKQLPKEARRPGATVDDHPELKDLEGLAPRDDWQILSQTVSLFGIWAYARVLNAWFECRACFPDLLRLLLKLFASTPNDVEEAESAWREMGEAHDLSSKRRASSLQILNPGMGKGVNRPKADRADSVGNLESFWPLEFLKFWGMHQAGVPRAVKGSDNRKTYVLWPRNVTLSTHRKVYRAFNRTMWANTAVKMDVLAALRYTDTFLEQWLSGQLVDPYLGERPGDHVSGIAVAFYKNMGRASSVLNLSRIALPAWMTVETEEQGRAYQALIEEHRQVINSLNEGQTDEYRLLRFYRDFLSGRDLTAFYDFTAGYAGLTMSRMRRGRWAPRFTTTNLEVLIMGHDDKLSPILESEGFQDIAAAIRRSTVIPQYFKSQREKGPYDVRYGLGAELLRQAAYHDQFIQALSEFVHDYNRETSQIHERYNGNPPIRRSWVTTEDIQQVVGLIDKYDSETIAKLLVAFGYARERRDREQVEGATGEDE